MGPKTKRTSGASGRGRQQIPIMEDSQSEMEEEPEQTEEEKRIVRQDIRTIYEKLMAGRDKFSAADENREFAAILAEAKNVVSKVKGTQEAIEDAKMFRLLCATVKEMSEDTNTNEKKFHVDEYSQNLARWMNASTADNGTSIRVTKLQLVSLGRRLTQNFRRAPTLKFVLGALETEQGAVKERKQRCKASNTRATATKTSIIEKSEASEQKTYSLVKSTKEILSDAYKANGKKPVNYFQFVIDPDSFGNTVENMFHVSFAVKDRSVRLSVDEEIGLPVLEPLRGGKGVGDDEETTKNQAIISISYQDWKDLKEALQIHQPAIVHDEKLRRSLT